jgi:hypothetical protein
MPLSRAWRRICRAYQLTCAREDAARLGFSVPDGVWFCAPCRVTMFDGLEMLLHGYCAG